MNQSTYDKQETSTAVFAGGCFWCMLPPFEKMPGVISVTAGYTGGHTENPTYEQVVTGKTGHYEAVRVAYNPSVISYEKLLDIFWRQINPTDEAGQFFDRGQQYETAIFYQGQKQKELAEKSRGALEKSARFEGAIATKIIPFGKFYEAEEYHQDYHKKNPEHYQRYKQGSGRQAFIEHMWGGDNRI